MLRYLVGVGQRVKGADKHSGAHYGRQVSSVIRPTTLYRARRKWPHVLNYLQPLKRPLSILSSAHESTEMLRASQERPHDDSQQTCYPGYTCPGQVRPNLFVTIQAVCKAVLSLFYLEAIMERVAPELE